jgi:hypothetical protein
MFQISAATQMAASELEDVSIDEHIAQPFFHLRLR